MNQFWRWVLMGYMVLGTAKADQSEESRCIERVSEAFQRLNVIFTENQLTPLAFDAAHVTLKRSPDANRKIDVLQFQTAAKTSIYCLPGSCDLLSLYRNDIDYSKGPQYDQPPKPNWTEEQALAAAKSYAEAVFGEFPKDVGRPTIKFEPMRNLAKYYSGRWHIRWPRIDAEGHLFNIDALNVYISESQGLASTALNFFSTYQEPLAPLISQDEALKVSNSAAESLASKWLGGGLQLGPHKIIQGIVNPNHILQAKTMEETVSLTTTEARLVWGIIYDLTASGSPTRHQVQVWVDAQTKEVVGGDLH